VRLVSREGETTHTRRTYRGDSSRIPTSFKKKYTAIAEIIINDKAIGKGMDKRVSIIISS
jgi:hypothetical protein